MFKDVIPELKRYSQLVGAIDWLEAAGLIIKVKIAHYAKHPLSAYKTAEIEFLRDVEGEVIPIEVKSGLQTKAKSLTVFNQKYHPPYDVIFSGKNMDTKSTNRRYLPLYLTSWFPLGTGKK